LNAFGSLPSLTEVSWCTAATIASPFGELEQTYKIDRESERHVEVVQLIRLVKSETDVIQLSAVRNTIMVRRYRWMGATAKAGRLPAAATFWDTCMLAVAFGGCGGDKRIT
jgi:hypothetical protein